MSHLPYHKGLIEYIFSKNYNSDYVDIVPLILYNDLNIVIFVIENDIVHHIISPSNKQMWLSTTFIAVQKEGNHYLGIKPKLHASANMILHPILAPVPPPIIDSLTVNLNMLRNNHAKNIIVAHNNINSLRNKFADVNELLENRLVDILGISESKLNDEFSDALFTNNAYKMHRKDRTATSGGLVLYVRADIPQTRIKKLEFIHDEESHIESLAVELTLKDQKLLILLAYKNPKVPMRKFVSKLDLFYRENYDNYKEILLMNDSNIDISKPSILNSEIINVYDLKNLTVGPTCFKKENGTPIDQIIVKKSCHFQSHINVHSSIIIT